MRITEVIKVDHEYRHFRKAQTLLQTIQIRLAWYTKHMPDRLNPTIQRRVAAISGLVQSETQSETLTWSTHQELSSRPLLQLPTKQICQYIFPNLPEPTASQLTPLEQSLIELMTMRSRNIAAQQHKFLLMCEIAYRTKHNWYLIFNTLTVAPGQYYAVFKPQTDAFKTYIRKLDRQAATAACGSIRQAIGQDYHKHFACVEAGAKYGRLHIHSLHFLKRLPAEAKDPNTGLIRPINRELNCLRSHWKHGKSAPIIVRYSPLDAFGLDNYRWPIDQKTKQPMLIKSPMALANYMTKYITKGYNSCQRSKLLWRVKKSHKLGTHILAELTDQLSISTLLILQTADNLRSKLNNVTIPQNLLRTASLRTLQNRLSTQPFKQFTKLTTLAKLCKPRLSPLHLFRASTQTIQENNQQSTLYSQTLGLNNEDTFRQAWKELQIATAAINKKYFRHTKSTTAGTASTRDHIYITSQSYAA